MPWLNVNVIGRKFKKKSQKCRKRFCFGFGLFYELPMVVVVVVNFLVDNHFIYYIYISSVKVSKAIVFIKGHSIVFYVSLRPRNANNIFLAKRKVGKSDDSH